MIRLETEYDYALVFVDGSDNDQRIEFSYGSCGKFDPIDFGGAWCAITQYGELCYPIGSPSAAILDEIAAAMKGRVQLWNGGSYLKRCVGGRTKFYGLLNA